MEKSTKGYTYKFWDVSKSWVSFQDLFDVRSFLLDPLLTVWLTPFHFLHDLLLLHGFPADSLTLLQFFFSEQASCPGGFLECLGCACLADSSSHSCTSWKMTTDVLQLVNQVARLSTLRAKNMLLQRVGDKSVKKLSVTYTGCIKTGNPT